MTFQHGNRIRRDGGEQLVRELELLDAEAMAASPTEEEIRQVAHDIYLRRGGAPGDAAHDWLEAENELRGRRAGALLD
ncbi:MAG: DUF2934 domain-containing protein [Phycisphaerales bacterium]|nr:DUF2934 domain-containing protein [Phycisphaerales bacterium]